MWQNFQKIKIIYKALRIVGSIPISLGKRNDKCEKAQCLFVEGKKMTMKLVFFP
jgi:hypothetical protein